MDWLRRDNAPISEKVWSAIDDQVVDTARHVMAARRIADFEGPHGWNHVASRLGSHRSLKSEKTTASLSVPDVILLTDIRAEFSLTWADIEAYERGAAVLPTDPAEDAARAVALAEDYLLFYGRDGAKGFLNGEGSPRLVLGDWNAPGQADQDLLAAVEKLDSKGIQGPYDLVLDSAYYYAFFRATAEGGGYPVSRELKDVLGKVHRSHVITGGALISMRGDDLIMTVGGDLTVGYRSHDREAVHFFCVESVAGELVTPEAVCLLESKPAKK
jgi:uncharacterized linocin/CFP29 family protein